MTRCDKQNLPKHFFEQFNPKSVEYSRILLIHRNHLNKFKHLENLLNIFPHINQLFLNIQKRQFGARLIKLVRQWSPHLTTLSLGNTPYQCTVWPDALQLKQLKQLNVSILRQFDSTTIEQLIPVLNTIEHLSVNLFQFYELLPHLGSNCRRLNLVGDGYISSNVDFCFDNWNKNNKQPVDYAQKLANVTHLGFQNISTVNASTLLFIRNTFRSLQTLRLDFFYSVVSCIRHFSLIID